MLPESETATAPPVMPGPVGPVGPLDPFDPLAPGFPCGPAWSLRPRCDDFDDIRVCVRDDDRAGRSLDDDRAGRYAHGVTPGDTVTFPSNNLVTFPLESVRIKS